MDIFNETPVEAKFEELVGEGKKYADQDAVAKAIVEKDRFITRLQEEARRREETLREAVNTKAFEDRIKALEAAQMAPPVRETPVVDASPAPTTPTVNIEETVQKAIEDREAANQRSRNLMVVKDKLVETFGSDFPNRVKAKAAELNISMERLNTLAAETPSAFFALILGQERAPDNAAPPASRVNSAAFSPQTGKKNNAYFSNMMKTNPAKYFTAATQLEEFSEMKRQGDAFYAP